MTSASGRLPPTAITVMATVRRARSLRIADGGMERWTVSPTRTLISVCVTLSMADDPKSAFGAPRRRRPTRGPGDQAGDADRGDRDDAGRQWLDDLACQRI